MAASDPELLPDDSGTAGAVAVDLPTRIKDMLAMGEALAKRGKLSQAVRKADQAREAGGEHELVLERCFDIYRQAGEFVKALETIDSWL